MKNYIKGFKHYEVGEPLESECREPAWLGSLLGPSSELDGVRWLTYGCSLVWWKTGMEPSASTSCIIMQFNL